jgi:predicted nucleotidyltransferase component of viral defense system
VIDRQQILDFSRELGLASEIVEKDYALGWLLGGIFNHPVLKSEWVFKGGTCLKKCYFETYRFSEDLDFTLRNSAHLKEDFLIATFGEVTTWVYENSGIELPADSIAFEVYTNPRGKHAVQGRVGYRGPMQRRGSVPRIKLDLTDDERLVLAPVWREVHHPYTDKPATSFQALCYPYEELFAEKMRALAERMRPRDLYDVIHLYRHDDTTCDRGLVVRTLQEKCAFKGIPVPSALALQNRSERAELEAEWQNMLGHQLPQLPPFSQFFEELPLVFEWLFGTPQRPAMRAYPIAGNVDVSWQPPPMVHVWGRAVPLEAIRFAASNRLCVDLDYVDVEGHRGQRLIEPYALRKTMDGEIIVLATRHDNGEPRSYRVDRIRGAEVTTTSFVPKYTVELTASGPLSIRSTAPSASTRGMGFGSSTLSRSGRSSFSSGPTYVIQCTVCGRRFSRKTHDTDLNPHKNKSGFDCSGRIGILVNTKY